MFIKRFILRLHSSFMNLSIKYKTLLLFYSIVIFISVLLGSYSYIVYSNKIEKEIRQSNFIETTKIRKSVDLLQKDIKDLSTFILLDSDLQKVLSEPVKSPGTNMQNAEENYTGKCLGHYMTLLHPRIILVSYQYTETMDFSTTSATITAAESEGYRR